MASALTHLSADLELASRAAARTVAEIARDAVAARGRFTFAVAGGITPRRLYELLGTELRDLVPWPHVDLFWGDERCVPPDDPRSNYRLVRTALLDPLSRDRPSVHRIPGEMGPEAAADAYHAELARFFGSAAPPGPGAAESATFDLVLLGLGRDGHTASLFPGHVDPGSSRWAMPARAPAGEEPADRVTMTLRALNAARRAMFLVAGEEKQAALARVRRAVDSRDEREPAARGAPEEDVPPAALVRATGGVDWFVDRAAMGA